MSAFHLVSEAEFYGGGADPQKLFENYYTDENFIWFSHDERVEDPELTSLIGEMYAVYEKKETGYDLLPRACFISCSMSW